MNKKFKTQFHLYFDTISKTWNIINQTWNKFGFKIDFDIVTRTWLNIYKTPMSLKDNPFFFVKIQKPKRTVLNITGLSLNRYLLAVSLRKSFEFHKLLYRRVETETRLETEDGTRVATLQSSRFLRNSRRGWQPGDAMPSSLLPQSPIHRDLVSGLSESLHHLFRSSNRN